MRYLSLTALALTLAVMAGCEPPQIPRPANEMFVTLGGFKTRYRTRKGTEPCNILYLHGFAADVDTWNELFNRQPGGCTAWSLDHIGYGIADRPDPRDFPYGPHGHASYALRFMEEMGIPSAYITGNSMGGAIAMTMARLAPSVVDGLILIDPKYTGLMGPIRQELIGLPFGAEFAFTFITPAALKPMLQRAYYDNRLVTPEVVERYARTNRYPGTIAAWSASARVLISEWSVGWAPKEVPGISRPALILWGAQDLLLPVSDGYALNRAIRDSELHILDECGHVPQEEKPAETASLIDRFIRRTKLGGTPQPESRLAASGQVQSKRP